MENFQANGQMASLKKEWRRLVFKMSISSLNDALFHFTFVDPLAIYEEPAILWDGTISKGFIMVSNTQTPFD